MAINQAVYRPQDSNHQVHCLHSTTSYTKLLHISHLFCTHKFFSMTVRFSTKAIDLMQPTDFRHQDRNILMETMATRPQVYFSSVVVIHRYILFNALIVHINLVSQSSVNKKKLELYKHSSAAHTIFNSLSAIFALQYTAQLIFAVLLSDVRYLVHTRSEICFQIIRQSSMSYIFGLVLFSKNISTGTRFKLAWTMSMDLAGQRLNHSATLSSFITSYIRL